MTTQATIRDYSLEDMAQVETAAHSDTRMNSFIESTAKYMALYQLVVYSSFSVGSRISA